MSSFTIRLLKKGSGTSLPGWLVETYFPWILHELDSRYSEVIYISGTNGKTTTRSVLVSYFKTKGVTICTNRGGANIMRGLAATLLLDQKLLNTKPKSKVLILEVEEATLPKITVCIQPTTLILTNIFRDQLDAYGEIDNTLDFFRSTLALCDPNKTQLVINADDYKLHSCATDFAGKIIGFSVDEPNSNYEQDEKSVCLRFDRVFTATICDNCLSVDFDTTTKLAMNLPGRYNVYNLLAAAVVGSQRFGLDGIEKVFNEIQPAFGRGEKIQLGDSHIELLLIKNPAGFNEVIDYIKTQSEKLDNDFGIVFIVNDNIADGRDVSWLWDVDIEKLKSSQHLQKTYTSGGRGLDMLLRLEYAGFDVRPKNYISEFSRVIHKIDCSNKKHWFVLSTYTGLLAFRKELGKSVKLVDISSDGN